MSATPQSDPVANAVIDTAIAVGSGVPLWLLNIEEGMKFLTLFLTLMIVAIRLPMAIRDWRRANPLDGLDP